MNELIISGLFERSNAIVVIEKDGQVSPDIGDEVSVKVKVLLPREANWQLREDLRFGRRLVFMGKQLDSGWGDVDDFKGEGYRSVKFWMSGRTYREAAIRAWKHVREELKHLEERLRKREAILQDAGELPSLEELLAE